MRSKTLDTLLLPKDRVELLQLETGKNVQDVQLDFAKKTPPKMPREHFFKDNNIFINKHHRFSSMPAHTHDFIELNYMYSGHCTQYINGEKVEMPTGAIILMDKDIVQQIDYVGQNDILVNILIKDDSLLASVLNNLAQSASLVTQFLFNASKVDAIHNNFILFDASHNEIALHLIQSLIIKGLQLHNQHSKEMNLILSVLLNELTHSIEEETHSFKDTELGILPILKFIDTHYQNTSLAEVAQQFGYNRNYLGNKLKAETGKTFHMLVNTKRLTLAQNLLDETDYSIAQIAFLVGFSNSVSLLKLFTKQLKITPTAYRNRKR
ncbi:AraC family transcriptional regulator [Pediococcus siamensis]|uniref:AraC family transcriptional regulator n=1 Tax=Pediococcus siamensis TaxID=381829 RepID=UPI0039A0D417